eukprot:766683-Hanusia_phi.AAC.10
MYGREEEEDYCKATKNEKKQAASQRNRTNGDLCMLTLQDVMPYVDVLPPARSRGGNVVPAKRKHAIQQEDSEDEPLAANNHSTAATGNHNK